MKRSIAVVAAGRGLAMLWIFATAQVMCQTTVGDEDSVELYRAVSEHKVGMVKEMITNKGLEKASRQLNITPLSSADINPTTDDDDDDDGTVTTATADDGQKKHCRRPRPRSTAYEAPEVVNTGTEMYSERTADIISQAKNDLPVFGKVESPSRNYDDQEFRDNHRRSLSVSERPRGRRSKSLTKGLIDPR